MKSRRWLDEHRRDPYVKQAREGGWRTRAVFKLQQIQQKDHVIRPGMTIVDLGAAPGGWCQYAAGILKGRGQIIALDILPMDAVQDVDIIQGDFREDAMLQQLRDRLENAPVDLVLSDMAPNISGIGAADQARMMLLAELVLDFCQQVLRPGGSLLVKLFQGEGFDAYLKTLRKHFRKVAVRKPAASRNRSREVYLLARNHRLV